MIHTSVFRQLLPIGLAGAGAWVAYRWIARQMAANAQHRSDDERVDEASTDSFPASDPPSFSGASAGPARRNERGPS